MDVGLTVAAWAYAAEIRLIATIAMPVPRKLNGLFLAIEYKVNTDLYDNLKLYYI